jgi:hypothetical protein
MLKFENKNDKNYAGLVLVEEDDDVGMFAWIEKAINVLIVQILWRWPKSGTQRPWTC